MNVPQEYVVEKDEKSSTEERIVLRANFTSKEEVEDWLCLYKASTSTEWIVKDEPQHLKKLVFHKYWMCQLNKLNKSKNSMRNKGCSARLDIKIKKINKDTVKNDKVYLKRDVPLPAVITISKHNHKTTGCFETLKYLRVSKDTKEKFNEYFAEGLSAGAAYRINDLSLKLAKNGGEIRANSAVNPTPRMVQYLFEKWRNSEYGESWGCDPFPKLREKIPLYESEGTSIHIDDSDPDLWAVLIVTPIMKRAQKQLSASEIIFTDTTSNVEFTQSSVTLMLTATSGGAVPIAILIHDTQSTDGYTKAYNLLKTNYSLCFGGKEEPGIFMTDNSSAEKGALSIVWPKALQFLCHFHIGQSEWRWLKDSKHQVPQNSQRKLMGILKNIMYAENTEDLETALEELENCNQANYIKHVKTDLLDKKEQWVKLFRHDTISRGHNTNNYAEATIRILKDIILTRTKAFNVTAMVEFVAHIWEPYFESRLLRYAYGRVSSPLLRFEELSSRMPEGAFERVVCVEGTLYNVPSGNPSTPDLFYEVETSVGWCSCPAGRSGAMCKHQALLYEKVGGAFPNLPVINCVGRYQLGKLALGESCPQFSFFVAVNESVPEEYQALLDTDTSGALDNVSIYIDLDQMTQVTEASSSQNEVESDTVMQEMTNDNDRIDSIDYEKTKQDILNFQEELASEIMRISKLAQKSTSDLDSYKRSLQRLVQRLKRAKTPNQAATTLISLNARANCTSKQSKRINSQPTSVSRRREDVGRGCGRIPAGRPPKKMPQGKRSKKPPHKLANSVARNKGHPKGHGH
ncbi:Protein N-lysine methyltransferase METTL21A [Frankliniella fusca]|uniref:Protein N-lysine methyltransferase METTL21A n=1 Tax=Frankliniella fusca TaxID=407009 RepID=A0AAE1LMD7_9NEOP|nr:Protein N-lysine methyltransferase METTL21A [Frankliniella fusca]